MRAVFVDVETTGLDFEKHVAIEIAVAVVDLNVFNVCVEYSTCITCDAKSWSEADHQALAFNGFNIGCLWGGVTKEKAGEELEELLVKNNILQSNAFFICQNPSFDRIFFHQLLSQKRMIELNMPYHWLDLASMYWMKNFAGSITINKDINLSKDFIAHTLGLPPEEKPHRALAGVKHLILCYKKMCES